MKEINEGKTLKGGPVGSGGLGSLGNFAGYAPVMGNGDKDLKFVNNAGSIFLGSFSPEAMGDYLAGPNHVLPTSGTARFSSGLSVLDFLKRQSVIKITKSGIERLGPSVINLANYENLQGHANSVKMRLKGY